MRAEAARAQVADEETMRSHVWDGDKAYQTDIDSEEVQRRIRDALVDRRNSNKPPPIV